jgi:hypothetical protein
VSIINSKASILKLLKQTNNLCAYCGERPIRMNIDHVIPISKGGTGAIANLVASCYRCNMTKLDKGLSVLKKKLSRNCFYFEVIGIKKGQMHVRGPVISIGGYEIATRRPVMIDPYEWEKINGMD